MFDASDDANDASTYECLDCGLVVTRDVNPSTCPECGSVVQNRAMSLE